MSSTEGSDNCNLLCQNGGICLPQVQSTTNICRILLSSFETSHLSQQANSSSACACAPGYTGRTCALPSTSCAQTPCLHNANCTDSPGSGAGYKCDCNGTGHSGAHCQMELNHCAGSPCGPGVCLPQPGGFLCECGPDHSGSTCANKRELGSRADGPRNLQVRLQYFGT